MNECKLFHDRLVCCLPYSVRTFVEDTLQSLSSSEAALKVLKTSIERLIPAFDMGFEPTIVAIGSFGRLDGDIGISDVDVIHIYPGETNESRVGQLRKLIRGLIEHNTGLLFDHRSAIVEERFDFEKSHAYPIIADDDITDAKYQQRALQILTEGRVLRNGHGFGDVRIELLKQQGYSDDINELNLNVLRTSLTAYRDSYCSAVMDRKLTTGWSLSNRNIIKLFALREFSYLATLFSIAEVSLAVALGTGSSKDALVRLSSPSVLKVASFCNATGPLAGCLNRLGTGAKNQVTMLVRKHVKSLPETERKATVDDVASPTEGEFFREVRNLTVPVLKQYDRLLALLHDPSFLAAIEPFSPDVTSWLGRPQFQAVLRARNMMLERARGLAQALTECLALVGENANVNVESAHASLKEIANYELRLDLATART